MTERLADYLDGPYGPVREEVRQALARPELAPVGPEITAAEYREQVLAWVRLLSQEHQTTRGLPTACGDLSLLVKTGVQFGLFGGAILYLGTRSRHDEYLADIASVELPGCFAMSESDRKDWIGNAAAH